MNKIHWGIIGCGDVTEVKSGPAFSKVPDSALIGVMRRNAARAADYADRHGVPNWYTDAHTLIHDPDINAIYIATPPSSHAEYAIAAMQAGKPVYVEKPMSVNQAGALAMVEWATKTGSKLAVAHYRRGWPLFNKIRELISENTIGDIRSAQIEFLRLPLTPAELADEKKAWRVNPAISGGGLFHDLAPHQLDILYWLFGEAGSISGECRNEGGRYAAADMVQASIVFTRGIHFTGLWDFNAREHKDHCEITGSKGSIRFSFFSSTDVELVTDGKRSVLHFEPLPHVQQPMIEKVVQFFLGNASNPCSGEEGAEIMRWIDVITKS